MISEKGLCKVLKSTYKQGGYEIVPLTQVLDDGAGTYRKNTLTINGLTWAVRCDTVDLPAEAAVQVVKDVGYLPVEAVRVQKGGPNQIIMSDVVIQRVDFLRNESGEVVRMQQIPVIFKERWQLYQTEAGAVYGFDVELLKLIDFKQVDPECFMSASGGIGIFLWGDSTVYIAPGRFSREDAEKVEHIAGLDWERQQEHDDPAANVCLFDQDEDAPLAERD